MATRPAIEDPVDPAIEIGDDVSGGRRAHGAGSVGRRRREGDAGCINQRASRFVRRRAQRQSPHGALRRIQEREMRVG